MVQNYMIFTKEEIKAWIPIFQAFVSDDYDILTSMRMMYSKEQVEESDIEEEYIDGDGYKWFTKKSDWIPIDKKCGLEIIRFNHTIVDPRYSYRVVKKGTNK